MGAKNVISKVSAKKLLPSLVYRRRLFQYYNPVCQTTFLELTSIRVFGISLTAMQMQDLRNKCLRATLRGV